MPPPPQCTAFSTAPPPLRHAQFTTPPPGTCASIVKRSQSEYACAIAARTWGLRFPEVRAATRAHASAFRRWSNKHVEPPAKTNLEPGREGEVSVLQGNVQLCISYVSI